MPLTQKQHTTTLNNPKRLYLIQIPLDLCSLTRTGPPYDRKTTVPVPNRLHLPLQQLLLCKLDLSTAIPQKQTKMQNRKMLCRYSCFPSFFYLAFSWEWRLRPYIFFMHYSTIANDIPINPSGITPTKKLRQRTAPIRKILETETTYREACQNRSQPEGRGCGIRLVTGFSGS